MCVYLAVIMAASGAKTPIPIRLCVHPACVLCMQGGMDFGERLEEENGLLVTVLCWIAGTAAAEI